MTSYVLGFVFNSKDHSHALLIKKARPAWQQGLLNGIGGHVELGETAAEAMQREFCEETGYNQPVPWQRFGRIGCLGVWTCDCFVAVLPSSDLILMDKNVSNGERVTLHQLPPLGDLYTALPNLKFLIPAALDSLRPKSGKNGGCMFITVQYAD